jgi:hypothetical protein
MIVAEYRTSLLAEFISTAATFTGTTAFSACADWQAAPSRAVKRRLPPNANASNALRFMCPPRLLSRNFLLVGPRPYLPGLGG